MFPLKMVIFHSYVSLPEGSLLEAKSKPSYIKLTIVYSGGDQDSKTMRRCPHPTTFCGAENGGFDPDMWPLKSGESGLTPKGKFPIQVGWIVSPFQ